MKLIATNNSICFHLGIPLLIFAFALSGCGGTGSKHSVNVTKATGSGVATIYVPQLWPVNIFDVDGEPGPNSAISSLRPDVIVIGDPHVYNSTWDGVADISVPFGRHVVKAGCLKRKGKRGFFDSLLFKKDKLMPVYRYFDVLLEEGEVANFVLPISVIRQMKAANNFLSADCPIVIQGAKSRQVSAEQANDIIAAIRKDGLQAWEKIPPPEEGQIVIKPGDSPGGFGELKPSRKPGKAAVID